IPDALTLAVTRTGELEVTAVLPGGKLSRVHRGDKPLVVTMRPGVAEIRRETAGPIEVKEIAADLSHVPELTSVGQFFPADPKTVDITFSNRIVSAGRGTNGTEGVALVAKLADALHASLGASRVVVDLGSPNANDPATRNPLERPALADELSLRARSVMWCMDRDLVRAPAPTLVARRAGHQPANLARRLGPTRELPRDAPHHPARPVCRH